MIQLVNLPQLCSLEPVSRVINLSPCDPGPASDCDSGPGHHFSSRSSPDDSRRAAQRSGGSAEDHPPAGGNPRHTDPAPESAQPRPPARRPFGRRVPRTAVRSGPAAQQESSSPRGGQDQNPRQTQRGEQLVLLCDESPCPSFFGFSADHMTLQIPQPPSPGNQPLS